MQTVSLAMPFVKLTILEVACAHDRLMAAVNRVCRPPEGVSTIREGRRGRDYRELASKLRVTEGPWC